MTLALEHAVPGLAALRAGAGFTAVARFAGDPGGRVTLDRVHFPSRRPIQLQYAVRAGGGETRTVLAEYCPGDTDARARAARESLAKSRNGQRAGLTPGAIVPDTGTGLLLRRPGLDERLPGLRLLHDPAAARAVVADLTGRDPGPVHVALVAHRLGKRAVLRIDGPAKAIYARLHAVKSGAGFSRLARHRLLWDALGDSGALRLPEPLGEDPALGLSLFSALPGQAPDLGRSTDAAQVAHALAELRRAAPGDLPLHRGEDEAALLHTWLDRCTTHRREAARLLSDSLSRVADRLCVQVVEPAVCHRDLHDKQVLIENGVAGLLDFDTACRADPALDPGNLMAHLFLARVPETAARAVMNIPGITLWRRAALLRLALIYAFTTMPGADWFRLAQEACRDDRD